jgi:hypothetical protein
VCQAFTHTVLPVITSTFIKNQSDSGPHFVEIGILFVNTATGEETKWKS